VVISVGGGDELGEGRLRRGVYTVILMRAQRAEDLLVRAAADRHQRLERECGESTNWRESDGL